MNNQPEIIRIGDTTFHLVYADLLPPLSDDEYTALRASIQQDGIRKPVHVLDMGYNAHRVIDGQHRLRIAAELGLTLDDIPLHYEQSADDETHSRLALTLNLARRHLTPDKRRDLIVRLRQQGQSQRAIADTLGVGVATVNRDLAAADAEGAELPDTVTGADGREHAATTKTPAQRNGEKIMRLFTGPKVKLTIDAITRQTGISYRDATFAVNLLESDGKLKRHTDGFTLPPQKSVGEQVLALLPDPTPADDLRVQFDQDLVTIGEGRWDAGASHRAIEIARRMGAAGMWDGETPLVLNNVYELHDRLFGIPRESVRKMVRGQDYVIDDGDEPDYDGAVDEYGGTLESTIIDVLEDGPLTIADLQSAVRIRFGEVPESFDRLVRDMHKRGVIRQRDLRYHLSGHISDDPDTLDYRALIVEVLREHGPLRLTELMRAARDLSGQHFIGKPLGAARKAMLADGLIALDDANRYYIPDDIRAEGTPDGEPAPDPAPGEGTDDRAPDVDLPALKAAILAFLAQRAGAYWNTIEAEFNPRHAVSTALVELERERKLRKSHDRFYELVRPQTELTIHLRYIAQTAEAAARESRKVPRDDMTAQDRAQLATQIAATRAALAKLEEALTAFEGEPAHA